jgi:hypothetical protein
MFFPPNDSKVFSLKSLPTSENAGATVPAVGKSPDVWHLFPFSVMVAIFFPV